MPRNSIHHFADEEDADFRDVAAARAHAALAWGHFQGQLIYLDNRIAELFGVGVTRTLCDEALRQAGYSDAPLNLSSWFAGQALSVETAHVAAPAREIVTAVLQTLRSSSWAPMAAVTDRLCAANCMVRDPFEDAEGFVVEEAIAEGEAILTRLSDKSGSDTAWPLSVVDELTREVATSPLMFWEPNGGTAIHAPHGIFHISAPPQRGFYWVADLMIGSAFKEAGAANVSIPLPGFVRLEALRAKAGSNRQNRLIAESLVASIARLSRLLQRARTVAKQMDKHFAHVRSTSRAPDAYILSTGFGTLNARQLQRAFGLSRAGADTVFKAVGVCGELAVPAKRDHVSQRI